MNSQTFVLNNYVCRQLNKLDVDDFMRKVITPSSTVAMKPMELPFIITPKIHKAIQSTNYNLRKQLVSMTYVFGTTTNTEKRL